MRPIAELSASPHWLTANLPIRAAREHSGNAAIMAGRRPGHVAAPHRWLPCSVLGPGGPPGGTSKECSRPSAPCASASALRPRPPRRGAAGYGPPLLRGYGPPAMRSPLRRGPPAPGSVGLGLSPPALTRRSAAVPAPHSPRYALWAARTAPALGPPVALGLLRVVPWPTLRTTAGSLPALLRRSLGGSPQDGPARVLPSLVPRSVGRSGRAAGSAPPAWGLERPRGPLFSAPRPQATGADTARGNISDS